MSINSPTLNCSLLVRLPQHLLPVLFLLLCHLLLFPLTIIVVLQLNHHLLLLLSHTLLVPLLPFMRYLLPPLSQDKLHTSIISMTVTPHLILIIILPAHHLLIIFKSHLDLLSIPHPYLSSHLHHLSVHLHLHIPTVCIKASLLNL